MLKIWGRANSTNVQKVLWCCGELGIDFRRIDAGGGFGLVDTPEYARRNPNRLVPVIDDDGFVLWESNAIVRYLAAKHGTGTLCPAEPRTRAAADRWMDWQATTVAPPLIFAFKALIRTPPEARDMAALAETVAKMDAAWRIFDRRLAESAYAAGDAFTMGDIPLGCMAYRWFTMDLERPDLPSLRDWYHRLTARPAFRQHVMLPLS